MSSQGVIEQPRFGEFTAPAPPQFASTYRRPVAGECRYGRPRSHRDFATFTDETPVGCRVYSVPRPVVPKSRVPRSEGSPGRASIRIGLGGLVRAFRGPSRRAEERFLMAKLWVFLSVAMGGQLDGFERQDI